jgi:HlyD family secretion protein
MSDLEVYMTSHAIRRIFLLVLIPVLVVTAIVYLFVVSEVEEVTLQASGTVESVEVLVASEVPGRIMEISVNEGDFVQVGDPLIRLDDELLLTQRDRAEAVIETMNAALHTAEANLEAARIQAEMTKRAARQAEMPDRVDAWKEVSPSEFALPDWYFEKDERIFAAEAEVRKAMESLEMEKANLQALLQDSSVTDLLEIESRLADARAAFLVAEDVRDQARQARDDEELEDFAEDLYEAAEDELEAAQSEYEQLLSDKAAEDILEARARLAVVQARYDTAQDRLRALQTGDHSLEVLAAEVHLELARNGVAQAEAALSQVKIELKVIELQLEKLVLRAPISGVVATRNVEPGEVIQPGTVALTIDQLDDLTISVYVPEDRYGQINLGQQVIVTVDSFPEETFIATVVRIADQAEFTPRNVQTDEGRRTTVFEITLDLDDPSGRLKPGMPADVDFGQ